MVTESGRVVALEQDALWVETIKRSTCSACVAKKGCGQSLLNQLGVTTGHIRVPLNKLSSKDFRINQEVTVAIPDDIVVKSSLLLYLVPLILMLVFSGLAHIYNSREVISLFAGIVGLFSGAAVVRYHAYRYRNDERYQPFLLQTGGLNEDIILVDH